MSSTNNDEPVAETLREKLEFLAQPVDGEGKDIGWWQTLAAMQQTEAKDCLALLTSQPVAAEAVADLVEGMSVSVDVSTSEADAGHRYFGTVTVAQEDPDGKHGLILLVQNAEPNFATIDLLCDCGHQDSDHDIGPDNPCLKCSCIRPNFYATAQTPAPVVDAAPPADGGVTDELMSRIINHLQEAKFFCSEDYPDGDPDGDSASTPRYRAYYKEAIALEAALKARGAA